jgi:hypothetical protein
MRLLITGVLTTCLACNIMTKPEPTSQPPVGTAGVTSAVHAPSPTPAAARGVVPGATYYGNHSLGGSLLFTISDDGAHIEGYSIVYPREKCGSMAWSVYLAKNLPIREDHTFSGSSPINTWAGLFDRLGHAEGTFQYFGPLGKDGPCNGPAMTWSATANERPDGFLDPGPIPRPPGR